jgi:hypothetical protein
MTSAGRERVFACLVVALLIGGGLAAQGTPEVFQGEAVEQFLLKARMTALRDIGKGVTHPQRATLELDGVTHFAVFKTIDESEPIKQLQNSTEVDFEDSWRTEISAYEVDKIIGLGMVPATVERRLNGRQGSLQFWVETMMPESERMKKKIVLPDVEAWNRSMFKVRLFDNLIYNVDRNLDNLLITKDFEIRLIDHSRSFRPFDMLKQPADLTRFSRSLLEGIKRLDEKDLSERLGRLLTHDQIRGLLRRRDAILALAQRTVEQNGEVAVLYP